MLRANLLLLAGLYALGVGPIRARFGLGPPAERWRLLSFATGVLLLALVLDGPIHELSDNYLFSAHMFQHMVLTLFAPPLLIVGIPGWLVGPIARHPRLGPIVRRIVSPLVAFSVFNLAFVLSHVPAFYQRTLEDHGWHIAEHLLFMFTAILTWWPVFSTSADLPRLGYPLRMLYVFGQTFAGFIVGSFLTNARDVLYPFYAAAPRVFPINPLDDQRLGGLLMWVVGNFYLLLLFTGVFLAWISRERVQDEAVEAPEFSRRRAMLAAQAPGASVILEDPSDSRRN
ncbi:MAG: cytochrome c oxidase assembly protein [Chloroflexota bacterium]